MKLEKALIELTTLVDYGTYYLSKKDNFYELMKKRIEKDGYDAECDILERIGIRKIARWIYESYSINDVFDNYTIAEFVRKELDITDVYDEDDLLDNIGIYSIKAYVRDNFDADDVYTESDMLDCMSVDDILGNLNEDDIKEWVSEHCDVGDWVSWN